MTTIITAANKTTVSILDTIGTVAHTANRTVLTVANTLDMLDMFVTTAHTKQRKRTAIDLAIFETQLLEDTALEESKRQMLIVSEINSDPNLKTLYTENHRLLTAVLNPA